MEEVGTRTYKRGYQKVFKEVLSSLVNRGFQLKKADIGSGHLMAIWKGKGLNPDEKVDVRIFSTEFGVQVTLWAGTTSALARRQNKSVSVPMFFSSLDGRIGDYAVDWVQPDGYPSYYPGPSSQLASHKNTPSIWYPISMVLTEGLFLIFFGAPGLNSYFGWPIALCIVFIGVFLLMAGALMEMGHLTAGGIIAIICGGITIPIGFLGIYAGLWAFRIRDGRVPLIPDHGYMIGGSG
jgi:hypothetical protein